MCKGGTSAVIARKDMVATVHCTRLLSDIIAPGDWLQQYFVLIKGSHKGICQILSWDLEGLLLIMRSRRVRLGGYNNMGSQRAILQGLHKVCYT